MKFIDYLQKMQYLHQLAEREATGSLCEISNRLGVSESTIKRMADVLRQQGIPIQYCKKARSYIIQSDFK
jgi:biotin operon repressor